MQQMISRRRVLGGLSTGTVGLLAGCSGAGSTGAETDGSTQSEAESSSPNGDQAFTIAMKNVSASWADHWGNFTPYFTRVYEPLVWAGKDMTPKPWLATDWESTGDLTWEFTLRDGVTFHNGEEMTAEHVVSSFEDNILQRGEFVFGWLHLRPGNVKALDEKTVEFTNTDPFPEFPGTIAHNMIDVQHPDSDPTSGPEQIIATGPFTVDTVKNEQSVNLSRFDDYWGDVPAPSALTFRHVTDPNTRALTLESGEVDLAFNPPKNRIQSLQSADDLQVITKQMPRARFLGLNLYNSPTDDVKLRRAMNHAIAQDSVVESILEGVGEPARGPISPVVSWGAYDDLPTYETDQDRGMRLVEESSYDGETLVGVVETDQPEGDLIAQYIQNSLDQIGIDFEIKVLEYSAYQDVMESGEFHIDFAEMGTKSAAADYIMWETFHSEGIDNRELHENEGTGLFNPGGEVDELINRGFQADQSSVKDEAYRTAQRKIMEQAVVVPLVYREYVVGMADEIEGETFHPVPQMTRWETLSRES